MVHQCSTNGKWVRSDGGLEAVHLTTSRDIEKQVGSRSRRRAGCGRGSGRGSPYSCSKLAQLQLSSTETTPLYEEDRFSLCLWRR